MNFFVSKKKTKEKNQHMDVILDERIMHLQIWWSWMQIGIVLDWL